MAKFLAHMRHRIYWAYRSLLWGHPLFKTVAGWNKPCPLEATHLRRTIKSWEFLRPFFAAHGIVLYRQISPQQVELCALPEPKPAEQEDLRFPYGRRFYVTDEEAYFIYSSLLVWAARDTLGRDVVIKLVSDSKGGPSKELKALQYLNTDAVRSDPRNHTIHVIKILEFEGLTFAIMPRWDFAFEWPFENIQQMMDCAETLFEGLEFLHEHRIYHGDILGQNCGINIISPSDCTTTARRDAEATRYVFYDFGAALLFPRDTPLEDIKVDNYPGFYEDGFPGEGESFHPFTVDVCRLGHAMQYYLRHIENLVPELGPFFDKITDYGKRPTAQQALAEFKALRSHLTSDQLRQTFQSRYWNRGKIVYLKDLTAAPQGPDA